MYIYINVLGLYFFHIFIFNRSWSVITTIYRKQNRRILFDKIEKNLQRVNIYLQL